MATAQSNLITSPPSPSYIFRGHNSPIHALLFLHSNTHLVSGDGDGWVVIWSLTSNRAVTVWKAHTGGVVGIKLWARDRLITHGRDHKLRVWKLKLDNDTKKIKLPVDRVGSPVEDEEDGPAAPWILHSMDINALNFCAFALCDEDSDNNIPDSDSKSEGEVRSQLIAAPNGLDSGGVDIFQLPSEHRVSQLHSDRSLNTGMVMALALFHPPIWNSSDLCLVSGYEDGHVIVHQYHYHHHHPKRQNPSSNDAQWTQIAIHKPHTQPVLSIDVSLEKKFFVSSSADATIAKFGGVVSENLDKNNDGVGLFGGEPAKEINTKHAGQQGLQIRSDGKIFATAGWDARVRVYSSKTLKELAVLKWHKDGCYAIAFATILSGLVVVENEDVSLDKPVGQDSNVIARTALDVIKNQREIKIQKTHWIAVGAKDAKISLWDIY